MSVPVHKTLAEIREDLYTRINAVQDEYAAKGWLPNRLNLNKGVVRGLIEIWAWGLYQLYQVLAVILNQAFPESASTTWLDLHADQVEASRKQATKAVGKVIFTGDARGNVPVPKGRILRTPPDGTGRTYRFVTTEDAVLIDGQTQVAVSVESEDYGASANATAGQISEIVTHVPGIQTVTNAPDWLENEGADEETDERLRERYELAWQEVGGATKHAYQAWALSVTGVIAAAVLDRHPRGQGTVDVVVRGAAGMPTDALLAAVDAVIQERRPVNDNVLVCAPVAVPLEIQAELLLTSGEAFQVVAQAETRIRALFTDPSPVPGVSPLQIGQDVPRDLLVATLMAVPGVKKVLWNSPATDVAVPANGLAVLADVQITAVWDDE